MDNLACLEALHREGLYLTIQENQPGPFGLLKMELLQGRDYLLSASRPLQVAVRMNDYIMLSQWKELSL